MCQLPGDTLILGKWKMEESVKEIPIDYKTSYEEAREELSNALNQTEECQVVMLQLNEQLKQKQNEVNNLKNQLQQLLEDNIKELDNLQHRENQYELTESQNRSIQELTGSLN